MTQKVAVGIIAPSSRVPDVEFILGVEQIKEAGFLVHVHPQCGESHLFFAGSDEERARAFFDYALDTRLAALWCARGGYGAVRILPLLEKMTAERGIPEKKLLVGYSDATALMEYVRTRWGWSTLHAPMPGLRRFCLLKPSEWRATRDWVKGRKIAEPWGKGALEFFTPPPKKAVTGQLVGGNLTVWTSLVGTPYAGIARNKLVFFEDVDENLYRVDRLVQQLVLAGALEGARAIVLGNFQNCRDLVPQVLVVPPKNARSRDRMLQKPKASELGPLRRQMEPEYVLREIFGELGGRLGIPVVYGMPTGHGPGRTPLPLGAEYRLTPKGRLELTRWDWVGGGA